MAKLNLQELKPPADFSIVGIDAALMQLGLTSSAPGVIVVCSQEWGDLLKDLSLEEFTTMFPRLRVVESLHNDGTWGLITDKGTIISEKDYE